MRSPALVLMAIVTGLMSSAAAASEPQPTVPKERLAASLHCQGSLAGGRQKPVLLLPGTGSDGADLYPTGFERELRLSHVPTCYLNLPEHTTGDMQISAEYVVFALRTMAAKAHRSVGVYGLSQGGVLARLALTFWPSTRRLVSDVVSASAPQHGSTATLDCPKFGCSAASWQRRVGSRLLARLNQGDETPGSTAWTTLRTLDDANALPVTGRHPTSALRGARNLLMQSICPGRHVEHLWMAFDAVVYAVLRDAMAHPGPARVGRLPRGVCQKAFVGAVPAQKRRARLEALNNRIILNNVTAPTLTAEPPVTLHR